MLKDRRLLLEQEITKAHATAAAMYLDIVTHAGDTNSATYQELKERILNLQFDLDIVNKLIYQGHE
jgi:hypothetical protein